MTEDLDVGFADDDERLSAFIDGELSAEAAEALERRLAAEPALEQRLHAMRRADEVLRARYGPVADEPLPAELTALLGDEDAKAPRAAGESLAAGESASGGAGAGSTVLPLRRRFPARRLEMPLTLAAGIAVAVGVGLGIWLSQPGGLSDTERLLAENALIEPESELFNVLEAVPSGDTAALDDDVTAAPRLSFRTADGGYCRELAISSSRASTALVGCREEQGWRLEAVVPDAAGGADNGNDAFRPAGGPASGLDDVIDAMIAGAPLGAEAEREAIATGWQ